MASLDDTQIPSPWHAGELRMQRRLGVDARMDGVGRRVIRDYMPDQHIELFESLPALFVGLVDEQGWPWAGLLEGERGFARAVGQRRLAVRALPAPGDPVSALLHDGAPIGMLGLQFSTRRRNRMNGRVSGLSAAGFEIGVEQSFGNCPQYIQTREELQDAPAGKRRAERKQMTELDEEALALIRHADTLFVASYADPDGDPGRRQVDASHRGGRGGFVQVQGNTLTIPDFSGNQFFNTLGNILETGKAGLLFMDMETGTVLQLTGTAKVDLDSEMIPAFRGAERLWSVTVAKAVLRRGAIGRRYRLREFSPNSLLTGSWTEADANLRAKALGNQWRRFKVQRIVEESSNVRSIHLLPEDEAGLLAYHPGQHLPIRVQPAGSAQPMIRTYTLSSAPSDGVYRISVKREGSVSDFLHTAIEVGSVIEAKLPDGGFHLDESSRRPVVMLSAGIGITPMMAMARHIVYEGLRTRFMRTVYFIHGARTLAERAFDQELEELAKVSGGALRVIHALSRPEPAARQGQDYALAGRVSIDALREALPFDDYDFYLCGPSAFMQQLYDQLKKIRIHDDRIFAEAFGPASLQREMQGGAAALPPASTCPVKVIFAKSAKEATWQPGGEPLLELAEIRGLSPEFSCRSGTCGSCRTHLAGGAVTYGSEPGAPHSDTEVLICQAVPAHDSNQIVLEL
jgi:uncharacterized protein